MKKHKKIITIISIVIIILIISLIKNIENSNNNFQDELIFFKLFSSGNQYTKVKNQTNQQHNQYIFNVSYKNIDFKDIYLADTINKETLIQEKIAPGTKGAFEIILQSNEKINFQIKFENKNEKPKNLVFKINEKDKKYENLKDMEQDLKGELNKSMKIIINWEWFYEKDAKEDLQDTKDGMNIKQYNFTIYAIGK